MSENERKTHKHEPWERKTSKEPGASTEHECAFTRHAGAFPEHGKGDGVARSVGKSNAVTMETAAVLTLVCR